MKLDYVKCKIENLISITRIVSIHYYELTESFCFSGEAHNFWEMVYADSGSVNIKAGDRDVCLKQGEVIFHKPNEFHTLSVDKHSTANVFVISFVCTSQAMSFFRNKEMTVPNDLKNKISSITEEYYQTFNNMAISDRKLKVKASPLIGGQQMIRTYLEQFLILLIRSEKDNRNLRIFPSKESIENHLVSRIIQIADENLYSKISVEDICLKLNYSRAYLSKIFKSASNYTISEYLTISKIKEAKKLICKGIYNFTEISDMLAFDNPHYFSRVFKRVANMTPSDYKSSVKTL